MRIMNVMNAGRRSGCARRTRARTVCPHTKRTDLESRSRAPSRRRDAPHRATPTAPTAPTRDASDDARGARAVESRARDGDADLGATGTTRDARERGARWRAGRRDATRDDDAGGTARRSSAIDDAR